MTRSTAKSSKASWWRRTGKWIWERVLESPDALLALVAGTVVFTLAVLDEADAKDLAKATLGVLAVLAFSLMRMRSLRIETKEDIKQLEGKLVATTSSVERLRKAVEAIESATPWRVLNAEIEWEIHKADGSDATCTKTRVLRFYQNQVMAVDDLADTSGKTVEHTCTPGTVIEKPLVKSGGEANVLIALPRPYQRGETETFKIVRKMKNKFPDDQESVSFIASDDVNRVVLTVIWPRDRKPKKVWITRRWRPVPTTWTSLESPTPGQAGA